jgi:hypothetical protein
VIRHIVMWRLTKTRAAHGTRCDTVGRLEANMMALRASVPGLLQARIGINQGDSPDASDLVLCCDFRSWDALRGYESHPLHDQLRSIIGPLRAERRVVDFEIDEHD